MTWDMTPRWYCPVHGRFYKRPLWTGLGPSDPKAYPFHLGCGLRLVQAVVIPARPSEAP